jgi:hypothetical protein
VASRGIYAVLAATDNASTLPNLNTWLVTGAVVIGLITALLGFIAAARARRTVEKVQRIAVSVDGQMSGMLLRIDQLISTMHEKGVPVPPPPSPEEVAKVIEAKNGTLPPDPKVLTDPPTSTITKDD